MDAPDIRIIDSIDEAQIVFIMVDNCKTTVLKTKLKDTCYVLTLVNNTCHINLDLKECDRERNR